MRQSYNHLTLSVTRKGGRVPEEKLKQAFGIQIRKIYPGGIFASAVFSLPMHANEKIILHTGDVMTIYNGSKLVFEGMLDSLTPNNYRTNGIAQGEIIGYWGAWVERRGINKRWVDNRIDEKLWSFTTGTTGNGDQQCTLDREARLRFTPKGVAWANGDYAAVRYTQPYGQTTKRITYSYDLQEGAQAWEISVWRSTDASSWTQMTNASGETYATGTTTVITSSGTGSIDVTLATPSRYLELRFYARGAQTPTEDGTYYGEYSSVEVYSETGNINAYEVANDIRAALSLGADVTWLDSGLTVALKPNFVTNDYEYYASILKRAADFGDASGNSLGYGLYPSTWANSGTPTLFLESRTNPATATTYDYQVSTHMADVPTFREDATSIRNWIVVHYTDYMGKSYTLDPNEQSTLTDTTSTDTYGERLLVVEAGVTDATGALALGERALAHYKDPLLSITGPLVCKEYLENSAGLPVPACEVMPGKIVKILAYNGLKAVITETNYNDTDKTVALTLGSSGDFVTQITTLPINTPLK